MCGSRLAFLCVFALALVTIGCADSDDPPESVDGAVSDGAVLDGDLADMVLPPIDADIDAVVDAAPDAMAMDAEVEADAIIIPPDVGIVDASPDGSVEADGQVAMVCDPPLSMQPEERAARPLDLVTFRPAGGTGAWQFSLTDDQSGALLNEATGAYLAGEAVGVVDEITLTDQGCVGQAVARIRVVSAMQVAPRTGEVERGDQVTFEVLEGSGDFSFELNDASGAVLTPDGVYTAGDQLGQDRILVTDLGTGETSEALLEVVPTVSVEAHPARIHLPVGARAPVDVRGGTNDYDIIFEGDGLLVEGDVLEGVEPGDTGFQELVNQLHAVSIGVNRDGSHPVGRQVITHPFVVGGHEFREDLG